MNDFEEKLELFYGAASEFEARIYGQVRRIPNWKRCHLSGKLEGPYCRYSETLPSSASFRDFGWGATVLAETVLPEPNYWTPEMPFLYRVRMELRQGQNSLFTTERSYGLRRLTAGAGDFFFEGRRFVLRGVHQESVPEAPLEQWRELSAAMVVDNPSQELCEAASTTGVLLVARVAGDADTVERELRRLGGWPAVGYIVVRTPDRLQEKIRRACRNTLLLQALGRGESIDREGWAHGVIAPVEEVGRITADAAHRLVPVIVSRSISQPAPLAEARAACDRLQADLARRLEDPLRQTAAARERMSLYGDFAGYLV